MKKLFLMMILVAFPAQAQMYSDDTYGAYGSVPTVEAGQMQEQQAETAAVITPMNDPTMSGGLDDPRLQMDNQQYLIDNPALGIDNPAMRP